MERQKDKVQCGIIMPISSIDGCNDAHWAEVLEILNEAIGLAEFEGSLVSDSDDVGVIHKRIIQNIYANPIVVCDVSAKNPNVMFELGMRLAFDKPTIIVKDDKTPYSFDTSGIEHLEYPRDLRFSKIVEFKDKLADKIKATYDRASNDPEYTTFLKHFGEFKVAKLDSQEVSPQEYIIEELKSLKTSISRLEMPTNLSRYHNSSGSRRVLTFPIPEGTLDILDFEKSIARLPFVNDIQYSRKGAGRRFVIISLNESCSVDEAKSQIELALGFTIPYQE